MDASTVICNCKNKKLKEDQNMAEDSDRISKLPDMVLQHILSFLSTKYVVGTTILSKRWQNLWTSIPSLEFQEWRSFKEKSPTHRKLFMNFVDRVLLLRDFSNIQRFSLSCNVLSDELRINAWMSAAVRRKVEEFHICLHDENESFVWPHCIFTSESLKVLELGTAGVLKLPSSIVLSNLKILTLANVIFSDDYSTQQLFSGCPVLEKLNIDKCNWSDLKAVTISAPRLCSLKICEMDNQSGSNRCQVTIFGTSLKFFSYSGEFMNDFCLYSSSSLVDACIYTEAEEPREVAYHVNKLIRELSGVKKLTLSSVAVEALSCAEELFAHLPMFNTLTHLELVSVGTFLNCEGLLKILQNSSRLESLIFAEGIWLSSYFENDSQILDPVPSCFLSHLKSIEVWEFCGTEEELNLVKILLKNATVLDRMVISCGTYFQGALEKKKAHEQLLMLPRGSTSSIIFS
uniref:F-box domain-containing protein n=1 Tax=Davidia involucrata TaxID=16924 RepID=A0A5B6Z4A4_DAVIN